MRSSGMRNYPSTANSRHCVIFCVTESDKRRSHAAFLRQMFRAGPEKTRNGSPLSFLRISMLRQPMAFTDSSAERFRHCFSGRKSCRQMARRKLHRHRIFDFAISKNAPKKPIAKSIQRMLDSRTLNQINTDTAHALIAELLSQMTFFIRGSFPSKITFTCTAFSKPTNITNETIECPMFNSVTDAGLFSLKAMFV